MDSDQGKRRAPSAELRSSWDPVPMPAAERSCSQRVSDDVICALDGCTWSSDGPEVTFPPGKRSPPTSSAGAGARAPGEQEGEADGDAVPL